MPLKSCYISRRKSTFSFEFVLTLIAEDAAPICFANALPWIAVTVAVFASRIRDALIAKFTFPSPPTPGAFTKRKLIKTLSFVLSFSSFFFLLFKESKRGGMREMWWFLCSSNFQRETWKKTGGGSIFFVSIVARFFFQTISCEKGVKVG